MKKGQSLIELLVVIGLLAILLPALIYGLVASREGVPQQKQRLQATSILNETEEAVRSVRESGWENIAQLTTGIVYQPVAGTSWSLQAGAETSNGFTRQIVFSDVMRNSSGAIDPAGTILDPSTKKVDITVNWTQPYNSSSHSSFYLTRFRGNLIYEETKNITLPSGGLGDWCSPNLTINAIDLPKSGVANAVSAIEGKVFAGTGNNSAGVSFANISISNAHPPVGTTLGTFDGFKTNAVFGESNYAYLGTDNNSQEVVIIDLNQYSDSPTNSKYRQVGSINLPGNINANSIYVVNNIAYILGSDSKLYIYNITNRNHNYGINDYSGVIGISGAGKKVLVNGDYAYIATESSTNQFQIFNVSNINSPSKTGELTLGSSQAGVDVYVNTQIPNPTRAYFVTQQSGSSQNFFIIDISIKNTPQLKTFTSGPSIYKNTNGMDPTGITVVPYNKAIIVGKSEEEYQVVDITTETAPTHCGGLNIDSGINGVSSVLEGDGDTYSYIITGDASTELKIIAGGPSGGGGFISTSTYESTPFPVTYSTAFNRFIANITQSYPTTKIEIQVAVANKVNNSCTDPTLTYSYVGPNGDGGEYFYSSTDNTKIEGTIPFGNFPTNYSNPGQCFRYKLFLSTTDSNIAPTFSKMTVNYSP